VVAVADLFWEHLDDFDGRFLVVAALEDGSVSFTVYRPGAVTSTYRVDVPPEALAVLVPALVAHTMEVLGVDELPGPDGSGS
jgi:hypothetical protein